MGLVAGSLCISGCVFVVCSFGAFCLLLFVGGFCCCVFLDLRLYLIMLVVEVCWSSMVFLLSIVMLLVVCLSGVVDESFVGVGGFMVWSM